MDSEQQARRDPLDEYFEQLEEEKGYFHLWSVEDKARLSGILPEMIEREALLHKEMGGIYSAPPIIQAIADYRFMVPSPQEIPEEDAIAIAIDAVEKAYELKNGWLQLFSIGRSLFESEEDQCVIWRITFWHTPGISTPSNYGGGRVHLNAHTGEVLCVETHGDTFDTSISYQDRL